MRSQIMHRQDLSLFSITACAIASCARNRDNIKHGAAWNIPQTERLSNICRISSVLVLSPPDRRIGSGDGKIHRFPSTV